MPKQQEKIAKANEKSISKQSIKYNKIDLLKSELYSGVNKDILNTLLNNDEKYTIDECNQIIEKEKKRVII